MKLLQLNLSSSRNSQCREAFASASGSANRDDFVCCGKPILQLVSIASQRATFPIRKTLEGYEMNSLRLPSTLHTDELTSCQFVRDKKNLVLFGL